MELTVPGLRIGTIAIETYQFGSSLVDTVEATGNNVAHGLLLPLRMLLGGPEHELSQRLELFRHAIETDETTWWDVVVAPLHVIAADAATKAQLTTRTPFEHILDWFVGQLEDDIHWLWIFISHDRNGVGGYALLDNRLTEPPFMFETYPWPASDESTVFRQCVLARRSRTRTGPPTARG